MKIDSFFAEVVEAAVWTEQEMEKELDKELEKEVDAGRFNPESETPLLSAEEDAGDFQLFAETYTEYRRNERKAQRDAIERAKREREEYKRLAPNLF